MKPARTVREPAAEILTGDDARLVVNVPKAMHRAIKARAFAKQMTIRDYVLSLVHADGVRPATPPKGASKS